MIFSRKFGSALGAAIVFGVFGCSSAPRPVAPPPAKSEASIARENFPARLQEARVRAWQTALEITEIYERIPSEKCPGIASLVADIRETERAVGSGALRDLDRVDANRLVTHNPDFWRAALEIAPTDGSLLLLQATLLASAGEIWRANRILVATTQLLPIPPAVRPYYLAQSYGLGSVILLSVRAAGVEDADAHPEQAVSILEHALAFWPKNAVILSELIDARLRARVSARKNVPRDQTQAFIDASLAEFHEQVDRLFELDPLSAAPYRGGPESRKKGRELRNQWSRLSDSDSVLGYKEIGELALAVEAAGAPELALVLHRLEVSARGFPAPSDSVAWRRLLPKLLEDSMTKEIFSAIDRGEINVVELNQGSPPAAEEWKGDPAIHPLMMQQAQREIADLSFQIELLQGNPRAEAETLSQRAIQFSRAGLHDAALADLDAAIKLIGREPSLLLDKAVVYGTAQRDDEAEKLLAEVEKSRDGKEMAVHERGILRFSQGRFEEARKVLRGDKRADVDAAYSAIMAELAARRLGQHESRGLMRARQKVKPGSWPDMCLAYLSNKIGDDVLLREAQQGDSLEVAQKLCEAYFILAQTSLAAGNQTRGINFLESCIGTGITGYIEFRLARVELKRLDPAREKRTRQWEEKTPRERPGPQIKEKKSIEEELMDEPVPA